MRTVRHIARAVGSTGSTVPAYRVEIRVGAHQLVADEPAPEGGGAGDEPGAIERTITVPVDPPAEQRDRLAAIAERTPVTLALRGRTPIATTFRSDNTS